MKHIALIGMPLSGKSTLGYLLAQAMRMPFLDLDCCIEEAEARRIPDIFREDGEKAFRRMESAALMRILEMPPCVIAAGGGVVLREENVARLRQAAVVVFLDVPLSVLESRTDEIGRPLLRTGSMAALYAVRQPIYNKAAHIRVGNAKSHELAINEIRLALKEWEEQT